MLRGHLPVFHDLLDLGSFVLKPDFHLGGEQRQTLRGHWTLGACPRLSPATNEGSSGPDKLPAASRLRPGWEFQPLQWEGPAEGALSSSAGAGFSYGATPSLCLLFILDLVARVGLCTSALGKIPLLHEGQSPRGGGGAGKGVGQTVGALCRGKGEIFQSHTRLPSVPSALGGQTLPEALWAAT